MANQEDIRLEARIKMNQDSRNGTTSKSRILEDGGSNPSLGAKIEMNNMRIGPEKHHHCRCSCWGCTSAKHIKNRRKTNIKQKMVKFEEITLMNHSKN